MIPRAMDSLDLVAAVMVIDELFGTDIPEENCGSPRKIVDWLEAHVSGRRPNKKAAALLKKLAKEQNYSELAESLDATWRREQIAAIIREIFRD